MSLFDRISARNLRRSLNNPRLVLGHIRRTGSKWNQVINDRFREREGTFVMDEEWDTLLLLDACRYDLFTDVNTIEGDLSARLSRGSSSPEFFERNFLGHQFHDTVYVTANPFITRLSSETFHAVVHAYETAWDEEHQTVMPEAMTDLLREAHETYPDKRIIGHYMQPHYPFLGEFGRSIDHRGYHPESQGQADLETSIWHQLQFGETDATREEVIAAYRENLELVLPFIRDLIAEIDGKTVISADHGNLIGERLSPLPVRAYGHPEGSHAPGLLKVPWFEPPFSNRREILAEPPTPTSETDSEAISDSTVSDRLQALGYRE